MKIPQISSLTLFPFLSWIGELKNPEILKKDAIAGITVAMILIPQSLAYAKLADLPVMVGLYSAFIPVIIAALFGSSRQMSTGPVTIISLMTVTALAPIAVSGSIDYIVYTSLLAFFIGLFYLTLWAIRGGIIVEFLSHPVITGFTNAVALITIVSQLPKIFGVDKPVEFLNYLDYVWQILQNIIFSTHFTTMAIGVASMFFLITIKKVFPKSPHILIVIICSIISTYFLHNITGIENALLELSIVGKVTGSLPDFSIPFLSQSFLLNDFSEMISICKHLGMYAIIIGLIGFTESMSVAKFVGSQTKQKINVSKELFGQGIANMSSSFFGGMGVSGSLSKTAVNLKAGAKTGFSGVITGSLVGITILFFLDFLYYLPIATLAAIIIIAVLDLIKLSPLVKAWKIEKHDGIVGFSTFILTLIFTPDIEKGIFMGIFISLMLYIYRSMRPRFVEVAMYQDGSYRDVDSFHLKGSKHISVLRLDSNLFFANSSYFESRILNHISSKKSLKYLVLDMDWVADMDISGIETFVELISDLEKGGLSVYICSLRLKVLTKLINYGMLESFSQSQILPKLEDTIDYIASKDGKITKIKNLMRYKPQKKLGTDKQDPQKIYNKYVEH